MIFAVIFISCAQNNSYSPGDKKSDRTVKSLKEKSTQKLIGKAFVNFTQTPPTFWNGVVDFENYGRYNITYIGYEPPKDSGNNKIFTEDFIIYEIGNPNNILLKGSQSGKLVNANKKPIPTKPLDSEKY